MRRRWLRICFGAIGLLAAAGLLFAAFTSPPQSLEQQTREVAQTLKCLTCVGEDVADSTAPVAAAMRISISEQLEQGKSPQEIRTWFSDRYGHEVLLDPPLSGSGSLLWLLPALLVGFGAWFFLRRHQPLVRRRAVTGAAVLVAIVILLWRLPQFGEVSAAEELPHPSGSTEQILVQALDQDPGDVSLHLALARELERQDRHGEAAQQYEVAARLAPFNVEVSYLRASALVRAGSPEFAIPLLNNVLAQNPGHSPSLLLLGTLEARDGKPGGAALLERFLALNPDHSAAAEVRELIDSTIGGNP